MKGPLSRAQSDMPGQKQYAIRPVLFGGEVSGKEVLYDGKTTNEQEFRSRNIQMAMALRLRAQRTTRLMRGEEIDPMTCLFIDPNIPRLERHLDECTKPIRRNSTQGRAVWEMDKRGGDETAKSPDVFDALCLAFARDSETGLRARG